MWHHILRKFQYYNVRMQILLRYYKLSISEDQVHQTNTWLDVSIVTQRSCLSPTGLSDWSMIMIIHSWTWLHSFLRGASERQQHSRIYLVYDFHTPFSLSKGMKNILFSNNLLIYLAERLCYVTWMWYIFLFLQYF